MIAMEFQFEAVYADGARQKFVPYRNFDNFAVSDIFYSIDLGNNWLTSSAESRFVVASGIRESTQH